jgi:hypothetical protein
MHRYLDLGSLRIMSSGITERIVNFSCKSFKSRASVATNVAQELPESIRLIIYG